MAASALLKKTAIAIVCLTTLQGGAAWATSFEFQRPQWDGLTELLEQAREQLGRDRVVLDAQLDWSRLQPQDALLIVHPTRPLRFAEASAFMSAGGRMALLDDFGAGDELLRRFHIRRVSAPSTSIGDHQGNPNLKIARPHVSQGPEGSRLTHPIVEQIDHVVTNHPAALAPEENIELTAVLKFPTREPEADLFAVIGVIGDAQACGLSGDGPPRPGARCGRLFAMSDPSVFIDLMMHFDGNRQLAQGLIRYLTEDDTWGPRAGKLYILSNDFHQTGHFGGSSDVRRTLESSMHDLRAWARELAREGLPKRLTLALAAMTAAACALWAWRSSGRLYRRRTPHYARAVPLVAQGGVAGRAAVLMAPTTQRELVVVELVSAAQESLRSRLGLPPHASSQEILQRARESRALDASALQRLKAVMARLIECERALVRAESTTLSASTLQALLSELEAVFAGLNEDRGRRH